MKKELPFKKELEKINLLIDQGQFELILPEKLPGDIRLIYLMNDAVESFVVFQQASITGEYQKEFQGELRADLEQEEDRYLLILHQGDHICTLFFQELSSEIHLFDYGKTGHFWVKGYEYLRQLEYRIAILRDKKEYLGEEFCTEEERYLSVLGEFPPLNFCCYPSVSEKYLVPSCSWWHVSEEALTAMEKLAQEAGDKVIRKWIRFYRWFPKKCVAKKIAVLLHRVDHGKVVDIIWERLEKAASVYEKRDFGAWAEKLEEKAVNRKNELEKSGKKVVLLREEPFLYAKDSVTYKLYLMIWYEDGKNRKVKIETIDT